MKSSQSKTSQSRRRFLRDTSELRQALAQRRVCWAYNRCKAKLEKPKVCLFAHPVLCQKAISNQPVFDVACVFKRALTTH